MKTLILFQAARKYEFYDMASSLAAAGDVDGQVVVVYSKYERNEAEELVRRLDGVFSSTSSIPYQIQLQGDGSEAGTLLAMFLQTHAYQFPGAKLLVDGGFKVKDNGWLDQISREHRAGGAKFTGRGKAPTEDGFVPHGPFVIDAPPKDLEIFRVGGSIRERGRHLFGRDCNNLHFSRYPFTLLASKSAGEDGELALKASTQDND